jgi:hypothetical protein
MIPFIFDDCHFCRSRVIGLDMTENRITQVIIRHRVNILFSVISSPISLEHKKWKLSKMKGILLLFTSKLLIKFQNILRNTTQVIIRHRVKILFSVISRIPFIFDNFHFLCSRVIGLDMTENRMFTLCRMITWVVFLRMFWNFISSLSVERGGSEKHYSSYHTT